MLLILGGLPGVGKTAVAAGLAREVGAVHLRIDSIEQALRNSGVDVSGPEGYEVAYAIAEDNLRLGRTVIADSVNPLDVTRSAWRSVAQRTGTRYVEIEIVCSDRAEHRRRVETRTADIAGHELPTWRQVCEREYEPWGPLSSRIRRGGKWRPAFRHCAENWKAVRDRSAQVTHPAHPGPPPRC